MGILLLIETRAWLLHSISWLSFVSLLLADFPASELLVNPINYPVLRSSEWFFYFDLRRAAKSAMETSSFRLLQLPLESRYDICQ